MATLTLPFPPSVNRLWRQFQGRTILSKEGRQYREAVCLSTGRHECIKVPVKVSIEAYPPDARRRDLDNILKALLDGLTHAGIWEDDSLIYELQIRRADIDRTNPRVVVEVGVL